MAENAERNLRLFRELITCTHNLYFWTYDTRFSLVYTNCPDADLMGMLLISVVDSIPKDTDQPILISTGLGFSWVVNRELDGNGLPLYTHVIGPAVASKISVQTAKEAILRKHSNSYAMAQSVDELFNKIPSVPLTRLMEYALMLHYCVLEEKLTTSDILFPETLLPKQREQPDSTANPYGSWLMEQKLLKLIEEGNLNFRNEASQLITGAAPADLGGGDIMRHYKNLIIAFISSCTRAAIRGGLSPETAYAVSDHYIRGVESCDSLPEVVELNDRMQEDFVRRVHQAKEDGLSPQIRRCCDYIQFHVEEELSLSVVSAAIGYAPAWLSNKFHKEMGKTVVNYITEQKMERAKELLISGTRPVQEIAEKLHYKTPSHFGAVFRQYTGMTPSAYREKRK